jgi:hypothetical protein
LLLRQRAPKVMMKSISPFGHKAVGDLFRRCETYSRQSLYVMKTTYPPSLRSLDIFVKGRKRPVVC